MKLTLTFTSRIAEILWHLTEHFCSLGSRLQKNQNELTMKKLFLLFILCAGFHQIAQSQDFEAWKKQQLEEFQNYKTEQDKAFNSMLKQAWEFVNAKPAETLLNGPKIVEQPKIEPKPIVVPQKEITIIKVDTVIAELPTVKEDVTPPTPLVKVEEPKKEEKKENPYEYKPNPTPTPVVAKPVTTATNFPFYGLPFSVQTDPHWKNIKLKSANPDGISAFYNAMANSSYEGTLNELYAQRKALFLNDWAFAQLIQTTVQTATNASENEVHLFTWFFLLKSGYNVKLGYNDDQIHILIPTQQRLFGLTYYTLDGTKFYLVDFLNPVKIKVSLFTYKGSYPDANRALDMRINTKPSFKATTETKNLRFAYNSETFSIPTAYNAAYVNMYTYYPQTDLSVYFLATLSDDATATLVKNLSDVVKGKDQYTQVNMILRFVQTAFEYKTDADQFGKEKYFFGDETLHYPYSDCEDRAILFASLVKMITGLDVVGVKYPGHLATAVKFTETVQGDQLQYNGRTYTICDPTYKNADIGMSMPKFKSQSITVVPF